MAIIHVNMGNALVALGELEEDREMLLRAVRACRAAKDTLSQLEDSEHMKTADNNLRLALEALNSSEKTG